MDSLSTQSDQQLKIDPLLLEVADVVNTTLDLDTTLRRVAELVRKVIDYEIFAILLLNEKTQELRFRFQVGYPREVCRRVRIKVGAGRNRARRANAAQAMLVEDVTKESDYIEAIPNVRSELAIPLIVKNRVIGVIDLEAREPGYFTEEHKRLLTLIASRMAVGIENAQLYTRTTRQARTLLLLNEIARELTSILNVDELLKRIAELLSRIIDYQMFSILLVDDGGEKLEHRFSLRFQESIHLKHDIPLGKGLVGAAATEKAAVLVPDVSKDPRYIMANPETKSELAVPLIYKDKVIGVLDLEHTRRGFFTEDHKRTITTLAAQVAIAIENARLYEQIARQERRLERDLALARELQFRLLAAGHAEGCAPGRRGHDSLRRAPSAATCTISCTTRSRGWASSSATSAARALRQRSMRRWSAGSCVRMLPSSPAPAEMLSRREFFARASGASRPSTSACSTPSGTTRNALCRSPTPACRGHFTCTMARSRSSKPPACPRVCSTTQTTKNSPSKPSPATCSCSSATAFSTHATAPARCLGARGVERVIASCPDQSPDCVVTSLFQAVADHAAGEEAFDDQTVVAIKVKGSAAKRK